MNETTESNPFVQLSQFDVTATAVYKYVKTLTDEQRLIFWHRIQSGYCRECGRNKERGICYCENDE